MNKLVVNMGHLLLEYCALLFCKLIVLINCLDEMCNSLTGTVIMR